MFEASELGQSVPKEEYKAQEPQMRVELINAQYELREKDFPVIILLIGDDRWGCSEVVDLFHEWMDARFMKIHFFKELSEEERERPRFWRYWRALPPQGKIAVYFGAWASNAVVDRFDGTLDEEGLEIRLGHIRQFEQALTDSGALVLKFWMHLPESEFKKRVKRAKKNPEKAWYVDDTDRIILDNYDSVMDIAERVIRETDAGDARWHIVESTDDRYRNLTVAQTLLDELRLRLSQPAPASQAEPTEPPGASQFVQGALDKVDLTKTLAKDVYKKKLAKYQRRLNRLSRQAREKEVSSVLAFEGWDAAGKGGVIRRLTQAMSPEDYEIIPVAAPTEEERVRHYLWRFWRYLPRAGRMLIFDRSWYGRVLVERVEGFAPYKDWSRAYGEINDFEAQIVEFGSPLGKFWIHIDPDEQLRRFKAREQTSYKKYKITEEDYRNREKWNDYTAAVNEMVARTSTNLAPWHLIAGNDKRWARIEVLKCVCEGLEEALDRR